MLLHQSELFPVRREVNPGGYLMSGFRNSENKLVMMVRSGKLSG